MPLDSAPSVKTIVERPKNVRVAGQQDEFALFDLLWNGLHADNSMGMGRSEARFWENINGVCRGQRGICGVIDGPDGKLIGSIGIQASQTWYSDAWFLSETWLFVDPDHRKGTRYGEDLFKFALWHRADISERLNHNFALEISVHSFKRLEAKTRLWRRHASHVGSLFWVRGEPYRGS